VVESADAREREHGARAFDGAGDGCISAKGHMRAIAVVVGDVFPEEPEQVPFAEHDHMIEQFAP
jgi:hypothetical protein